MFDKKYRTDKIPVDVIHEDPTFKKIWGRVVTQRYFIEGVSRFGVFTTPTGYMKGDKCFLLGHKCSVDASIELGEEQIEINIVDIIESEIVLFLIIFLSKEHKSLKCTAELIRLILEYIETLEGKEWFKTILEKGDKEDRIAEILGIKNNEVKQLLFLLKPGRESWLIKLADGDSLHSVVTECKQHESGGEKKSPSNNVTGKSKKETPKESTNDAASSGAKSNKAPKVISLSGDEDESPEFSDDDFWSAFNNELPDNTDEDPDEQLEEILSDYLKDGNTTPSEVSDTCFIRTLTAELPDGSVMKLVGKGMLTVEGTEIKSFDGLVKNPDGTWQLPANCKSFYLTFQAI